jgi:phenylpropionate dioxygenase-like ring-hydroxylating dioxygenase large terminal subunit
MFLEDVWYLAMPARRLKRGKTVPLQVAGQPLLFGRKSDGGVFALRDLCPHRAMPLSYGAFDGTEVECAYHGWRFDGTGACTHVPALPSDSKRDCSRIRVKHYPCRDSQGMIWVYLGEESADMPDPPVIPDIGARGPQLQYSVALPCNADHGIVGLIDPAHGPFVHRSWWWRNGKKFRDKQKKFAPTENGFVMVRHTPSSNSPAYKLMGLGKPIDTEITFRLPGVRMEFVRIGDKRFVGLTAVTPVTETESRMHHAIYWTAPQVSIARPFLWLFMRLFLNQDRDAFRRQSEGLAYDPPLMLFEDADMQARWYFQLKADWPKAKKEGRPVNNPAKEMPLRWRS